MVLYPPLSPYRVASLKRGRHEIAFEEAGNPRALPVLFLHGGPGSRSLPDHRRFFHPDHYRILLFDQRGCGRSRPLGELEENTTWHLLEDMEALRRRLGISEWLLFGGSWGATLALLYAQTFPSRSLGLILRAPFLAREQDWLWFLEEGGGRLFPELYQRLGPLLADPERAFWELERGRLEVARALWLWEGLLLRGRLPDRFPETGELLARATIFYHYARHRFFLKEGQLLEGCPKIGSVPAILVHGRRDLVVPPESSHLLYRRLPRAELWIVEEAGHIAFEPAMAGALVRATDRFAQILR